MKLNFRHGIVKYSTPVSPSHLSINGGFVDLIINESTVMFTAAYKDINYLFEEMQTVRNAWGPFVDTLNTQSSQDSTPKIYLFWDVSLATGEITRGWTKIKPILDSTVPPAAPAYGQHWYDHTANVMKIWNNAYWLEVLRVFVGVLEGGVKIDYYAIGSQVNNNEEITAGYVLYGSDGKGIKNHQNQFATTEDNLRLKLGSYTSPLDLETVSTFATAVEPIPKYSLVYIAGDSKIGLASSDDILKSAIGMVTESAFTGEATRYYNHGIVTNELWSWPVDSINKTIYCGAAGELTLVKSSNTVQKIGKIISKTSIFLNVDVDSSQVEDTQQILDSSSSVKGITYLSVDPIKALKPIAVGDNDPRMSDSRKPLTHTHKIADVESLQATITDLQNNKIGSSGGTVNGYLSSTFVPIDPLHMANKRYVDAVAQSLDPKNSCRVATTQATPLFGYLIIDGVELRLNDRVLVKNQTNKADNGIYVVRDTNWTRAPDANESSKISSGMYTFIEEGIKNNSSGWAAVVSDYDGYKLNVSPIDFFQFSGAGQIEVGPGLIKNGNFITLNLGSSFDASSGALDITKPTGLVKGTYSRITVDEFGRVLQGLPLSTLNIEEDVNLFYTDSRVTNLLSGGALSTYVTALASPDKIAISDSSGKLGFSSVSTNELNAILGSRSNLQVQIDNINSALDTRITTEVGTISNDVASLTTAMENELGARYAADSVLDVKISQEINDRTSAVTALASWTADQLQLVDGVASSNTSHVLDATVHLTPEQNSWIDNILISAAEVNYLAGVTSNIQSQISNEIQARSTQNASTQNILEAHVIDSTIHVSQNQKELLSLLTVSAQDLNRLTGITGNVQAQISSTLSALVSHSNDQEAHMTVDQNAFLDSLFVTGAEVNTLSGMTGSVASAISNVSTSVNATSVALTILDGAVSNIDSRLGTTQTDLATVSSSLSSLLGSGVTLVVGRVDEIETSISDLTTSIAIVSTELSELSQLAASIEADVSDIDASVTEIQNNIGLLYDSSVVTTGTVENLQQNLDNLKSRVDAIDGDITELYIEEGALSAELKTGYYVVNVEGDCDFNFYTADGDTFARVTLELNNAGLGTLVFSNLRWPPGVDFNFSSDGTTIIQMTTRNQTGPWFVSTVVDYPTPS